MTGRSNWADTVVSSVPPRSFPHWKSTPFFRRISGVPVQGLEIGPPVRQDRLDDMLEKRLREIHVVVQIVERDLRLHHPEFCQMTPGFRFLGAERRTEDIYLAEGHGAGFPVQLAGLREIRLPQVEIVGLEERGRPLTGGGGENRCVEENESSRIEEFPDRPDHLVAYPQYRVCPAGAEPEVTTVHQKIDAVLLGSDGIVVRNMYDLEVAHVHLKAARGALLLPDPSCQGERSLLGQLIEPGKHVLGDAPLHHHPLEVAGAVAEDRETYLAARALVIQPALDRDGFSLVRRQVFDINAVHRSGHLG